MDKQILLPVLKEAYKYAAGKKSTLPVLTTLKIVVDNGMMTIDATNLEDYFTCSVPTDSEDMAVLVNAKVFRDQINVMDSRDIQIGYLSGGDYEVWMTQYDRAHTAHKTGAITIHQGRSAFKLWTDIPVDEYPGCGGKTANEGWTQEQVTLASGSIATIYHRISEADEYMSYNEEKSAANNLFPKYLKIEGVVAKKNGRAWLDYNRYTNKKAVRSAYCMYQYGDKEQKVSNRELENYEVIELGKRGRK